MTLRAARGLIRNKGGAILPLVALSLSALIGFTGLGVEAGFWYAIKRVNQSVADEAALSGAMELLAGYATSTGLTEVQEMGTYGATQNRFTPTATICGPLAPGRSVSANVIITQSVGRAQPRLEHRSRMQ